jgi:hypothetical protein
LRVVAVRLGRSARCGHPRAAAGERARIAFKPPILLGESDTARKAFIDTFTALANPLDREKWAVADELSKLAVAVRHRYALPPPALPPASRSASASSSVESAAAASGSAPAPMEANAEAGRATDDVASSSNAANASPAMPSKKTAAVPGGIKRKLAHNRASRAILSNTARQKAKTLMVKAKSGKRAMEHGSVVDSRKTVATGEHAPASSAFAAIERSREELSSAASGGCYCARCVSHAVCFAFRSTVNRHVQTSSIGAARPKCGSSTIETALWPRAPSWLIPPRLRKIRT